MRYYEIRDGSMIIGTCTSESMRRYQKKYCMIIATDEDHAEMVQADGEDCDLYRDGWMQQSSDAIRLSLPAEVREVTKEEYIRIRDELMNSDEPIEAEPEPAPQEEEAAPDETYSDMTKTDMLEMMADLEMRVAMLEMGVTMV